MENLESPLPRIQEDEQISDSKVSDSLNSDKQNNKSATGVSSHSQKKVINFVNEGSPLYNLVEEINKTRVNNSCTLILKSTDDDT